MKEKEKKKEKKLKEIWKFQKSGIKLGVTEEIGCENDVGLSAKIGRGNQLANKRKIS